jgi:integrase
MTKRAPSAAPKQGPDGRWSFVVDAGVGPDGRRRQAKRRGFATKREASAELDRLRGQARTKSYTPPAKVTVRQYLDEWLASLPTSGLRPSTVDGYRRCCLYVPPALGARRLDQLTTTDLDKWYSDLLASGRRQREGGLSPRSVRYVHVVISKALSDAVDADRLSRNVALKAKPPRAKTTRAPEQSWWSPSELARFLDATADEPLGALWRVAAMTGMRRGEVCGLRWSDVDLDTGKVEVRQQLNVVRSPGAPDGGLVFSPRTKTDHGRRTIALDPGTVATLKRERTRQKENQLAVGAGWANTERGLVFTEADGRPLDPESVAKTFVRRQGRLDGLPRARFHDLRHSHVAHLIAAGEIPLLIARRLGHASSSFTMDRYGHLFPDADSGAASAVAAMVDGSSG